MNEENIRTENEAAEEKTALTPEEMDQVAGGAREDERKSSREQAEK